MLRVDERVARCLSLLRAEEFAPLLEYLRNCRAESLEKLAVTNNEQMLYQLQGEAGVLREILELVSKSGELAEKLRR
jgi:hypothetical protein